MIKYVSTEHKNKPSHNNQDLVLAIAQVHISKKIEDNINKARTFSSVASTYGADVIIFPEMFMTIPSKDQSFVHTVKREQDTFLNALAEISRNFNITTVAGTWETSENPHRVFNSAVTINSEGKIIHRYRKLHLFDALKVRESDFTMPGNSLPQPVTIKGIKMGVIICYDLRFPELMRSIVRSGCDVVAAIAAWYSGIMKEEHWLTLLKARAIENTVYVAGCNTCGRSFSGRSAIFDPFGVCISSAGEEEAILFAEISKNRIESVREKLPVLKHIRKGIY